jgi:pilus assembly protein CpaE
MKICVLGDSAEQRAEVIGVLRAIADPKMEIAETAVPDSGSMLDGKLVGNGTAPPDALMILLTLDDEAPFTFLHRIAVSAQRPALIALMPENAPTDLLRRAVRSGADEVLFSPLNRDDLTRAIIKTTEAKYQAARRRGGIVLSVSSLTGGIGVSSVSINLALALGVSLGRKVALVDLDLQNGTLATNLNVATDHSILSVVEGDRSPDSLKVEAALTRHGSGIYLLAAPRRIEDSELVSDTAVAMTLELMRAMFDVVIVDTGNHLAEQTVVAWEESDQLLYLVDQSIASTQRAVRFNELFTRLQLGSVVLRLILNRHVPGYPITAEHIAQALSRPICARLPRDDKAMERVELSGKDLWRVAPGSPLARGFEDLARLLVEPASASAPRSTTAMSRMVSAFISRRRGVADEAH